MRINIAISTIIMMAGSAQAAIVPTAPAGVHCAATAEAAVARLLASEEQRRGDQLNEELALTDTAGFRVVAVRFDAVAQRRWAMVSSCAEPARPLRSVALPRAAGHSSVPTGGASPMLVRTGDTVAVVRETADSRLQLQGTAIDSGALQGEVRVRMPPFSDEAGTTALVLRGTVVAPGVVEVRP